MYWTDSLLLLLLSHACCFPPGSCLTDLDPDKVSNSNVIPEAGKSLLFVPLRSTSRRPAQFVTDLPGFTKPQQLNQRKSVNIEPTDSRHRVQEVDGSASSRLDNNNPYIALTRIHDKRHTNETSTPSGSAYPTKGHLYNERELNGALSEDNNQWFDQEDQLQDASLDVSGLKVDLSDSDDDTFPCMPCDCSFTTNRSVIANCAGSNLRKFPLHLPSITSFLNLSKNDLVYLKVSDFINYPLLSNVNVTINKSLKMVRNGSRKKQRSKVKFLNLTSCSIRTIQDASFDVTPELTHLIISHNNLTNLSKSTFKGLGKLLHLDLSDNKITYLEVGTFDDLNELLSLDLSGNKQLGYTETRFPPLLFQNLKLLQNLSINNNIYFPSKHKLYPSRTLMDLVELRELSIDGLANPAEFGPEMKALEKLTSLEIRGRCQIVNITETFFQNIPHLTSFTMDGCVNFVHVHPNSYTKLGRLQTLSISTMCNYKLETAFQDLVGLNTSSLRSLTFRHLQRPQYQCRLLGYKFSLYLHNFSLVHLDLSENSISFMETDFIKKMPTTITTLILNGNKFTHWSHTLNHLSVLEGITVLDLSMQNNLDKQYHHCYSSLDETPGFIYPDRQLSCSDNGISSPREKVRHVELMFEDSDILREQTGLTGTDQGLPRNLASTCPLFKIPPNLHTLKASHYTEFGMLILTHNLTENNSLSVIDFSSSFLTTWGTGRLPRRITHANLGYNYCWHIDIDFFQDNNSHLHLLLNHNFLGDDFANDTTGEIFSKLSKTEYLDISANLIVTIPKQFFSGLSSLRYLHMSDNKLSILNASFAHMKTLQFIDFSRNSISWIDAETRDDLDVIAASPGHVLKVDLTMNPLPCTCDGLELISWMATTKVHFHKKHELTCYPDNKVSEPLGDLEKRRQRLQRSCMSKSLFIIGGSAALTVAMVIVTLGFMYRYRWKLRYLHNTTMAAVFGFKPEVSPKSGCTFDAYFVYTTDTRDFVLDQCLKELELRRGHRLCVEDRDFWPGTYIVSSIVSAVRNSTKTVVVLTPDLLEEPYCEYSFKMAVMEELYKQRTVLHLLLYQLVDSDQMSHDELSLMKRNSYIEYPSDGGADEGVRREFWDKLSRVIGHSGSDKTDPVLDME